MWTSCSRKAVFHFLDQCQFFVTLAPWKKQMHQPIRTVVRNRRHVRLPRRQQQYSLCAPLSTETQIIKTSILKTTWGKVSLSTSIVKYVRNWSWSGFNSSLRRWNPASPSRPCMDSKPLACPVKASGLSVTNSCRGQREDFSHLSVSCLLLYPTCKGLNKSETPRGSSELQEPQTFSWKKRDAESKIKSSKPKSPVSDVRVVKTLDFFFVKESLLSLSCRNSAAFILEQLMLTQRVHGVSVQQHPSIYH